MQAVAHMIEQLTAQLSTQLCPSRAPLADPSRLGLGFGTVIEPLPETQRWSESPVCDSADDVDEDEAYFLDEDDDDDDDDDDDYDEDEDDDYGDDGDDNDKLEKDEKMDEDDF